MAYTEEDRRNHITEMQNYLRRISRDNSNIPLVIPSGVYDVRTEQAITQFQREYGLPVTGKVDRATWEKIYQVYLETEEYYAELASILPFPNSEHSINEGESGFEVYMLQAMLNTIFSFYGNIAPVPISGTYGPDTAEAVRQIQDIVGEKSTGNVDYRTWNRLAKLYNYHAMMDAENKRAQMAEG